MREMTEQVVLGLVEQGYVAEGVTLYVGYQILSKEGLSSYHGPVKVNYYGRKVPPSVHGTGKLGRANGILVPYHRGCAEALRQAGGQGLTGAPHEHRRHPFVPGIRRYLPS